MPATGSRLAPLVWGLLSLAVAAYLLIRVRAGWTYIVGPLLLLFAFGSLKTALFASDKEIRELTTNEEVSKKTDENLRRRS